MRADEIAAGLSKTEAEDLCFIANVTAMRVYHSRSQTSLLMRELLQQGPPETVTFRKRPVRYLSVTPLGKSVAALLGGKHDS